MLDAIRIRLEGVRRSGKGDLARCPAHADKDPSLSIKEGDDGRVLLHCFAGCAPADIVAAMGLTMADLFPPSNQPRRPLPAPGVSRRELEEAVEFEKSVLYFLKSDAKNGRPISTTDMQRGQEARKRIAIAREALNHG